MKYGGGGNTFDVEVNPNAISLHFIRNANLVRLGIEGFEGDTKQTSERQNCAYEGQIWHL